MSEFEERWYQTECVDALVERVQVSGVNPIGVVPTGGGKTIIIAKLIERFLSIHPDKNVVVLSHVREILQQNYKSLSNYLDVEVGVYSAMLNRREIRKVTIAGIQSVHRKSDEFDNVGMMIVDECHMITDEDGGMYRRFLSNFDCGCAGVTATPFRSRGYLHKVVNAFFTEIAYDLSSSENFRRLIDEGYLSKIYCKGTNLKMDTTGIAVQAGDFSNKQLDMRFNTEQVSQKALDETIKIGKSYKKWLIFAISIDHAESIRDYLNDKGVNTGIVHSKMDDEDCRDRMLDEFRSGFYKAMVNVNVLTTGLDIPDIDMIVMLRPTKSPVIYAQSIGRGLRVAEGKDHCVVLDFANNVATHGPIDNITIRQKGEKQKGEPVTKECPKCMLICHPSAKTCDACGHEFAFKVKIDVNSSGLDILKKSTKAWVSVHAMTINRHKKKGKPDSIRIDYVCGLRRFSQWAAVKSNSHYAAHSAKYVLCKFYDFPEDFSYSISDILALRDEFKIPKRIFVDQTESYPQIESMEF